MDVQRAPFDAPTEQAVLGAILTRPEVLDDIDFLKVEHFFLLSHKFIFEAILALSERHEPIDILTVWTELKTAGHKEIGPDTLTGLINSVYSLRNIDVYAEMMIRMATRRRLFEAAEQIANLAAESEGTVSEVMADAEGILMDVTQGDSAHEDKSLRKHMSDLFDSVEQRHVHGGLAGISTGYKDWDEATNGLHHGEVTLVGARPAMGKTSMLMNLAYNALLQGKRVCFLSLEMSEEAVSNRLMAMNTGMDSRLISAGTFKDSHWEKFATGTADLAGYPMWLEYCPGLTLSRLNAICRKLKHRKMLDILFVDYIGLMVPEGVSAKQNPNAALSSISKGIKIAAGTYDIPVVVAAQLNRELKDRTDKRPMLWDLRDSGSLEQDADNVSFLHREDYYSPKGAPGITEIIIAKQRNGPVGSFTVKFIPETTKFVER